MSASGERSGIVRDPFEGVTLFDTLDEPSQIFEAGELGVTDWHRAEVYDPQGYIRVVTRGVGDKSPESVEQNLRTGHRYGSGLPEVVDGRVKIARDLLAGYGVDLTAYPSGYPEVVAVVEAAQQRPVLHPTALTPGKHYLHISADRKYGKETPLVKHHVFQHDRTDEPLQTISNTFVAVHYRPDPRLGKSKGVVELWTNHLMWEPKQPFSEMDGGIFGTQVIALVPEVETPYDTHAFYELTDDEVETIGSLTGPNFDLNVGTDFDKVRTCVHAALSGLQYSRWLPYEQGVIFDDTQREAYAGALTELIGRFGEEAVLSEAKIIMTSHLNTLHMPFHLPNSPYKPHSDGTPYGKELMDLARTVTGDYHYIAENMRDSGHWVNFHSLFGDEDFWAVTLERYPNIFHGGVDHLLGLGDAFEQTGSAYLKGKTIIINPIALIREHYPAAYQQIIEARPDFTTIGTVAIALG